MWRVCWVEANRTANISPKVDDPGFRNISFDVLVDDYKASTRGLIEGGVDIIMIRNHFRYFKRESGGICG